MVAYAEAVLIKGYTKKAAYQEYVDDQVKDPKKAFMAMEKKKEFQEIWQTIAGDANAILQADITRVRTKYANLVEQNIDMASDILDDMKDNKETFKNKAAAVRLVNETISAMAIVSGGTPAPEAPRRIDHSGVVS